MSLFARLATPVQVVLTLFMYVEIALAAGLAMTPAVYGALTVYGWVAAQGWPDILRVMAGCVLAALAYFGYALTVIFVAPLFRVLAPGTPEGRYPYYSFKALQWASYNALILLVRYTCINFLRVTPFIRLFHRLMGMKIGHRVQINTAVIGDSNLIEIGDDTVVGGDVTLVAHSAERGELVTARVRIGRRVTLGLMSIILPGCEIGDGAVLAANAVLQKGTKVGPGEIWGGVPARKIGERGKAGAELADGGAP
ncbi:MAG TPA: DapH/DapD/GlmU-related protein [Polyangia bacterium]|jgi:non-ribosomal peptide synthetase-like protein